MISATELKSKIAPHNNGVNMWYRHPLVRNATYSSGVKEFMEAAQSYWLLDILLTEPKIRRNAGEGEFAIITISVKNAKARIVATGDEEAVVFRRNIDYTDMPDGDWKFYFGGNALILPGEY